MALLPRYATSFLTIGSLWLIHHGIMAVSFLPFPTKLMAEALHENAGEEQAVLFYGACLLVITSIVAGMGRYAARTELIADADARSAVRRLSDRLAPSLGFYFVVILLAVFAPTVAVFGFLALAIHVIVGRA